MPNHKFERCLGSVSMYPTYHKEAPFMSI